VLRTWFGLPAVDWKPGGGLKKAGSRAGGSRESGGPACRTEAERPPQPEVVRVRSSEEQIGAERASCLILRQRTAETFDSGNFQATGASCDRQGTRNAEERLTIAPLPSSICGTSTSSHESPATKQ
jgi:hypothetical protein